MLPKPLDDLVWQDILDLSANGISETTHLEFKREPIDQNLEVARDAAAMANGGGGDLILGVPEINGVAQPPTPFPNGERHATRTVSIVLSGVEPRLRIATKVLSATQGDIVIVRIQRSRMPAMVHLDGRTEFWFRRDRQRVRMSQQEIVAMVTAGLQEVFNRERFLQERFNKAMRGSGSAIGIFLAATPDNLSDDVVSIHDRNIQGVMQESSQVLDTIIEGVRPVPTLQGLEG